MTSVRTLLSSAVAISLAGLAYGAPESDSVAAKDQSNDLSERLDSFFSQAIESGLLERPGSASVKESKGHSDVTVVAPQLRGPCPTEGALDLFAYADVVTYQDLLTKTQSEALSEQELGKALISVGLYAEAIMQMQSHRTPDSIALVSIARLLENRKAPSLADFTHLADCDPEGGLWLAVALIASGDQGGGERLQKHLGTYRTLPLQVRADVAAITIPTLERSGQLDIARKLLASFKSEDIAEISRLQFSSALIDMADGDEGARAALKTLLSDPKVQMDAMETLSAKGESLSQAQRDVLLDQALRLIRQSADDRVVAIALRFALKQLGAEAKYQEILELAGSPSLDTTLAQNEIAVFLADDLMRTLESAEVVQVLSAIDFLLNDGGLLDHAESRDALFEKAADRAAGAGYDRLAARLSSFSGSSDGVARLEARLALQNEDRGQVYRLSVAWPEDPEISLYAALAALEEGNRARLEEALPKISLDDKTIVALIEQDALSGAGALPETIYARADKIEDPQFKARVAKANRLRRGDHPGTALNHSVASTTDMLAESRARLETLNQETH